MRKYKVILKTLSGDDVHIQTVKAKSYVIHPGGFHVFYKRSRIIRAINSLWVVDVQEI